MPKKSTKADDQQKKLDELTADLQRTRADFENYRKRGEQDKENARVAGKMQAVLKLLPVIDTIERAISHAPDNLKEDKWVQGVTGLTKQLDKALSSLELTRIDAKAGSAFNPELHEAIQMDEDAEGENEVIAEELQAGYKMNGNVLRHSMVKVTKK